MSDKNFMSYGDAETVLTDFANGIKAVKNPQFTEASTRNNIASGESYTTIFGKIKKFFSDLKTVAFTGSYNDLSNKPDLSLKADKTDIDDVYKVMGKNGAKNVIPFPYDGGGVGTHTVNGISFIVGPSGGITISGTATADAEFAVAYWLEDILEDGEDYIVSAEGINGSLSTYYLSIENINRSMVVSSTVDVTHDEVQFTASAYRINCLLKVKSGQTISSVTIYPMIRLASDTDSTYQRYAKTNRQLTDEIDDVPTQNSSNPVKSGGIFSTMAVPKYDAVNRREYYEGGSAFSGNIDSVPTAGSNNAVASGGTKTYVDNAVSAKQDTLVVVTATLASSASGISISYPTGLNKTNAFVVGWNLVASNWKHSGFNIGGKDKRLQIALRDNEITVYNDDSAFYGKTIYILLAKIV